MKTLLDAELDKHRPRCPGCGQPLHAPNRVGGVLRCTDCGGWFWVHVHSEDAANCVLPRCGQGHITMEEL